jgi:hypothetical protein
MWKGFMIFCISLKIFHIKKLIDLHIAKKI